MDYRQLGRSGLRVSSLTLGTMTFGGARPVRERRLDRPRRRAAPDRHVPRRRHQPHRHRRRLLRRRLGGDPRRRRWRAAATACCWPPRRACRWARGPTTPGLSRHHLIRGCEASLRRLRTDHIDLYQVHEWDGQTPLEETLDALDDLVRAGKVRYVGCSNYAGWQLVEGARRLRAAAGCSASSASRSTTRCRPATPSTSWCRPASTRASGSSSGARWPAGCCRASTAATQQGPEGGRHLTDWDEPPVRDRGAALRHRRGAGGDRRGARRLGRAGRARVAAAAGRA